MFQCDRSYFWHWDERLNREQAVNITKEILSACHSLQGKSLKLLPPREDGALSHTFQIHIELTKNLDVQGYVADIAKKHNVAAKERDGWLIIYEPVPRVNANQYDKQAEVR